MYECVLIRSHLLYSFRHYYVAAIANTFIYVADCNVECFLFIKVIMNPQRPYPSLLLGTLE